MDGLELNLFKSENVIRKKKTVGKSKKKFLKKKLNQNKRGSKDKAKNKKKTADKKEINQSKEISTIQDEFSSGLEDKKVANQRDGKRPAERPVQRPTKKSAQKPAKNDLKTNDSESKAINRREQFKKKVDKSKKEPSQTKPLDRPAKPTEHLEPVASTSTATPNNLAISMINDEFSDGLTDLNPRASVKRKFNEDERVRLPKKLNRPQERDHRSERPHQKNNLSAEELKNDFNKMFSSKGKKERLENQEGPNRLSRAGGKFERSERRPRRDEQPRAERARERNEFISNCFESNPEIPVIRLKNLAEENKEGVFRIEDESFDSLNDRIHPHLIACLAARQGITKMTNVQSKSIPVILDEFDCLVKSVTGSGKTLAYIIPIIQRLQAKTPKISRNDGIYALIIVPTRELVMQCYGILESLCKVSTDEQQQKLLPAD